MATQIRRDSLRLPVTGLLPENPLPKFSDPHDRPLRDGGLLPDEKEGFAKGTGFRVLPYRMQDRYTPSTQELDIPTIILENDQMRATFLPGYGGRLYSLWDKRRQKECLYTNSEIVIRNLALRNAWFSGGIEWNFGHFGHTYFTCQDVFFAACTDEQGKPFLRMYEFERCKQVTFQVDFHLPENARALTAHMTLYNQLPDDAPIFLWTNTALPQEAGMRVYSGAEEVIVQHLSSIQSESYFAHGQLSHLFQAEYDASDPSTLPFSTEYFFQNEPRLESSFEAAHYGDGRLFLERSTANFPYRKVFCWGTHAGGQHWQRFLAGQNAGDYLEVQAGLARTQVHPSMLKGRSKLHITQQFTLDTGVSFAGEYSSNRSEIMGRMDQLLPAEALQAAHEKCIRLSSKPATELLHLGYGWGALEKRRDPASVPAHLDFPEHTLTSEQEPWTRLLSGSEMTECSSFMVSKPWITIMEDSPVKTSALWNLLGIAYFENGRLADAKHAWDESLQLGATPLVYRNLACLAWRQGHASEAFSYMTTAISMVRDIDSLRPYALEYLHLLTDAKQYADAFAYYRSLPQTLQSEESVRLAAMVSAFHQEENAFLEELFDMEFSTVKEGDASLHEIWFMWQAKKKALESGTPLTDALLRHVKETIPLPKHLDFRATNTRTI